MPDVCFVCDIYASLDFFPSSAAASQVREEALPPRIESFVGWLVSSTYLLSPTNLGNASVSLFLISSLILRLPVFLRVSRSFSVFLSYFLSFSEFILLLILFLSLSFFFILCLSLYCLCFLCHSLSFFFIPCLSHSYLFYLCFSFFECLFSFVLVSLFQHTFILCFTLSQTFSLSLFLTLSLCVFHILSLSLSPNPRCIPFQQLT